MEEIGSAGQRQYKKADGNPSAFGARDETRTHTGFTPLAPETSASTISPPAQEDCKYKNFFLIYTTIVKLSVLFQLSVEIVTDVRA